MIIKEYRIPMPLDVEEYRIAQLYMIAKKSKLESQNNTNGVEILINQPYEAGPGGSGQYTEKIYHIEAHLPYWLRPFIPKSISTVKEKAWNAYPYSKNDVFTPYMTKFSLELESRYVAGGASQENIFGLVGSDFENRVVDIVDFVKERGDCDVQEDPLIYKSEKTKRGPLTLDWLPKVEERYAAYCNDVNPSFLPEPHDVVSNEFKPIINGEKDGVPENLMCVYKLCRVRFEQWPVQSRMEHFIHDMVKKMLVSAHRQAWVWQDEWHDLTMSDIRAMELETQAELAKIARETPQA